MQARVTLKHSFSGFLTVEGRSLFMLFGASERNQSWKEETVGY